MPRPRTGQLSWRQDAGRLLQSLRAEPSLPARMHAAARALLGRPYLAHALVGGPQTAEQLVVELRGFDCVTLVEQVLALASAPGLGDYVRELRGWRYQDGAVDWLARLHYFEDWLDAHQQRGRLQRLTGLPGVRIYRKQLSSLAGYPPRRRTLQVVPVDQLLAAAPHIAQGTVVAFASTRPRIDHFHVGLLFWEPARARAQKLMLYHAARSAGEVRCEPLRRFLDRNTTRGLALATPVVGEAR